ncbi:hypothetical protein ABXR98_18190 [Snodgrassella alvi]|uniref:hypothetical protein n=1 Tax=Snodgrassella TaxID=1193515 RepID=UPI001581C7A7|nr:MULTISPECIES: hypothetical protein [Snodgrassella]MBI0158990.1 hypothetical protein [Snodgrassella sp. W6238H11]MBI0161175.1 hypothetical protein [Snodgrassella sp. W6238H14]MBI0165913.1 hypothetical protein [Snodgrassella sp. M0351]MBI0180989.1 hypothetical protein [Snodgrassella sp. W8158]NUE81545.1 hypothetical protein [Snodgrassella sp. ESL0304]
MTIFVAESRHLEAYMLRLFPPAMAPITNKQVLPEFCHINLRENNTFGSDIRLFIRYKLKRPKKVIIYSAKPDSKVN